MEVSRLGTGFNNLIGFQH